MIMTLPKLPSKEIGKGCSTKISGLGRERWMEKMVQANSAVLLLQEVRRWDLEELIWTSQNGLWHSYKIFLFNKVHN